MFLACLMIFCTFIVPQPMKMDIKTIRTQNITILSPIHGFWTIICQLLCFTHYVFGKCRIHHNCTFFVPWINKYLILNRINFCTGKWITQGILHEFFEYTFIYDCLLDICDNLDKYFFVLLFANIMINCTFIVPYAKNK